MTVERRPNALETEILKHNNKSVRLKMANRPVDYRVENEIVSGEVSLTTLPFPGEESIRYDGESGELFIRSFRSARNEKLIEIPERIPGKGIPKVEFIRHTPFKNVERAIRQADHIADEYDKKNGKESISVSKFINIFRTLSLAYQDMSVTEEQFTALAENTLASAEETGYGSARLEWKNKVFEGIMKSFQRDRQNRRNRGASRMRAVHLYPLTTEARLVNEKTHNKYRRIAFKLNEERGRERDKFEDSIDLVHELRFLKGEEFAEKRIQFMKFAYNEMNKQAMKFAPYAPNAARVRFLLLGKEGEIENLKKYIGTEEALKYKKRKAFRLMDDSHQKVRLAEINKILEETLLLGEKNLQESSDDWVWGER